MRLFGLIGYPLTHSFSAEYFAEKFAAEGITDVEYRNFPITDISMLPDLLRENLNLAGFNVTAPYKEQIIPYLDKLSAKAQKIGAVNCVSIKEGKLTGYNTDCVGFGSSLLEFIGEERPEALILGSGGAAKAVVFVLNELGIKYKMVSRSPREGCLSYTDITPDILSRYLLVVNATSLGTFPDTEAAPDIPYAALSDKHYIYDLVYNPPITQFIKCGQACGAAVRNGYGMLVSQAEEAWRIFNG